MAQTKTKRPSKLQLGQFFTPFEKAQETIKDIKFSKDMKVLEPGCGLGGFLLPLIDKFLPLYKGSIQNKLDIILNENVYGIEIDPSTFEKCINNIKSKYDYIPKEHNICCVDFFRCDFDIEFDYIIGNPPFGGTINPEYQDKLDKKYGRRDGHKIKKETYSFFLVKSFDALKPNGQIIFICSDTFLTINTHSGLRRYLMDNGQAKITRLDYFSDETAYPMVVINYTKSGSSDFITLDNRNITREAMSLTGNFSWTIDQDIKYFGGKILGDFVVCTGGMTTGKNEYFVREIKDNTIIEPYRFEFFRDKLTLEGEKAKARLHKLSSIKAKEILKGKRQRNVRIVPQEPQTLQLLNPDYCYYNKADNGFFYKKPKYVIYWKNDGDAVKTFKKNGNWYLHGVGGAPYFKREGLTWGLISSRLKMRYLPSGYILDSGSPCAFLKEGISQNELYFILGWCNSDLANTLLKKYINHTKNIQGKDVEKLPYPSWVKNKEKCIDLVRQIVIEYTSKNIDFPDYDDRIIEINRYYHSD